MKYELALQLKDAGFPQKYPFYDGETKTQYWGSNIPSADEEHRREIPTSAVYLPSLHELIDACGEGFVSLEQIRGSTTGDWQAYGKGIGFIEETPEEAVAHLWLKLNEK